MFGRKKTQNTIESGSYEQIDITGFNCLGTRKDQQDSLWFTGISADETQNFHVVRSASEDCFALVADGMGGLQNGRDISQMVTHEMERAFYDKERPGEPIAFMQNALWKASEKVNDFLIDKEMGGSTIVAVYIRDHKLYFMSVGDSRIYLLRAGRLMKLNLEHNLGNELDDMARQGIIPEEVAKDNMQRAALTSFIGMGQIEKIDGNMEAIELCGEDVIMIMSDGVFGTLGEEGILQIANNQKDSEAIAKALSDGVSAVGKTKQDNFTAVILKLK